MANLQITAGKSNRSLVNSAMPDRAADLGARRRSKADPTLLGYRRFLEFNTTDACRTRCGIPTMSAITGRLWFQKRAKVCDRLKRSKDKAVRAEYFLTFEGCCELLELDVESERTARVSRIETAWRDAAVRTASEETSRRRNYLLACIGLPALTDEQYVLGLVGVDEYEEIAGIERPDPPARTRRATTAPRSRRRPGLASTHPGAGHLPASQG